MVQVDSQCVLLSLRHYPVSGIISFWTDSKNPCLVHPYFQSDLLTAKVPPDLTSVGHIWLTKVTGEFHKCHQCVTTGEDDHVDITSRLELTDASFKSEGMIL